MIWTDDQLPVDEPGNPLPELPEGFRDRLWQRFQEEVRRERRRRRVLSGAASAAVAVVFAVYGTAWYRGAESPRAGYAPVAAAPGWPAAAPVPVSAPPAAAPKPRAQRPHPATKIETAAAPAAVKVQAKERTTLIVTVGEPGETTSTVPAPPPQAMPMDPAIELARDSGNPPDQGVVFRAKGTRYTLPPSPEKKKPE